MILLKRIPGCDLGPAVSGVDSCRPPEDVHRGHEGLYDPPGNQIGNFAPLHLIVLIIIVIPVQTCLPQAGGNPKLDLKTRNPRIKYGAGPEHHAVQGRPTGVYPDENRGRNDTSGKLYPGQYCHFTARSLI